MRPSFLVAALATVVALTAPKAGAARGGADDADAWLIADTRGTDGVFRSCVARRQNGSETGIAVSMNNDRSVFLILEDPALSVTEGRTYRPAYRLDQRPARPATGVAGDTHSLAMLIHDSEAVLAEMADSRTVSITLDGKDYEQSMDGAKDALAVLRRCLKAALDGA